MLGPRLYFLTYPDSITFQIKHTVETTNLHDKYRMWWALRCANIPRSFFLFNCYWYGFNIISDVCIIIITNLNSLLSFWNSASKWTRKICEHIWQHSIPSECPEVQIQVRRQHLRRYRWLPGRRLLLHRFYVRLLLVDTSWSDSEAGDIRKLCARRPA